MTNYQSTENKSLKSIAATSFRTAVLATLAFLLTLFALTSCSDDDDDLTLSNVPSAVQAQFANLYPSASVRWEREGQYYKAEFLNNMASSEAWFTSDGTWVRTETDFSRTLPEAVQTYITTNYAGYTIDYDDIEWVETPSGNYYYIELERAGSQDIVLRITESGTLFN